VLDIKLNGSNAFACSVSLNDAALVVQYAVSCVCVCVCVWISSAPDGLGSSWQETLVQVY